MGIAEQKAALRTQIKSQFKAVYTKENRALLSAQITAHVTALAQYRAAHTLFCFVGTAHEPDTLPLIRQALADGKRVAVPLCTGPGKMQARQITTPADLTGTGAFGILEPLPDCPVKEKSHIDFALVPCLACAAFGWAVICPEVFLLPDIPAGQHDLKATYIVTEKRLLQTPLAPTNQ